MLSEGLDSKDSWVIAVASSAIFLLTVLPLRLSGQLFVSMLDRYNTDRRAASFPFALAYLLRSASGPFAGYFGEKFGLQEVTLLGCLICALGTGFCFFAEDIIAIDICLGLILGIGCGLATSLIPEIINQHFDKHRAMANGIVFGGVGIGAFAIPPILEAVLKKYGLSGSFLILAGFLLNGIPAAMLLHKPRFTKQVNVASTHGIMSGNINGKDVETPTERVSYQSIIAWTKENLPKNIVNTNLIENSSSNHNEQHVDFNHSNKDVANYNPDSFIKVIIETNTSDFLKPTLATEEKLENCFRQYDEFKVKWTPVPLDCRELNNESERRGSSIDKIECIKPKNTQELFSNQKHSMCNSFNVLWSPIFLFVTFIQSTHVYVIYLWWTIIVDVVRDKHVKEDKEVYFVVAMALFDSFGRFGLGFLTDWGYMTRSHFSAFCFSFMGLTSLLMPFVSHFYTTMFIICVCGLMCGGNTTGLPGIVTKFISKDKRTMAMASRLLLYAPMSFTMSPLIGYFRGNVGSYDGVFYVMTVLCTLCSVILIILQRVVRTEKEQEND